MNIDTKLKMDINEFATALALREDVNMTIDIRRGRNYQLWDLGLEPEQMFEDQDVKDKIRSLENEFDQVLILEHLDEGLVLMAQSLCWSLQQVFDFCFTL